MSFVRLILQSKFFPHCKLYPKLKFCYNMCTPIIVTPLSNSWTYANLLMFCNVKTLWIFMLSLANFFWPSINLYRHKCLKNIWCMTFSRQTWSCYVIMRFFWVWFASSPSFNVFRVCLSLLKPIMCLFAILMLWRLSDGFTSHVLWTHI
jgi:hypothetical protein